MPGVARVILGDTKLFKNMLSTPVITFWSGRYYRLSIRDMLSTISSPTERKLYTEPPPVEVTYAEIVVPGEFCMESLN